MGLSSESSLRANLEALPHQRSDHATNIHLVPSELITSSISRWPVSIELSEIDRYIRDSSTTLIVPETPEQLSVKVVYRKMHPTGRSYLVNTELDSLYVMKGAHNSKGDSAMFNEACGAILGKFMGVPMGAWNPVYLDPAVLERYEHILRADCDVKNRRPSSGIYFGGKLRCTTDVILDFLPRSMLSATSIATAFACVGVFDLWVALEGRRSYVAYANRKSRSVSVEYIRNASILSAREGGLPIDRRCVNPYMVDNLDEELIRVVDLMIINIASTRRSRLKELLEVIPPEWSDPRRRRIALDILCTRRDIIGERRRAWKVAAEEQCLDPKSL